jgi:hypothetical protein
MTSATGRTSTATPLSCKHEAAFSAHSSRELPSSTSPPVFRWQQDNQNLVIHSGYAVLSSPMKAVCKLIVLLLLFVLALAALGVAAFIGIGALMARWFPVSLFQASALAIAVNATIALMIQVFITLMQMHMYHKIGTTTDWNIFEDNNMLPITPTASAAKLGRNQPCARGSVKKFKCFCEQSLPECLEIDTLKVL